MSQLGSAIGGYTFVSSAELKGALGKWLRRRQACSDFTEVDRGNESWSVEGLANSFKGSCNEYTKQDVVGVATHRDDGVWRNQHNSDQSLKHTMLGTGLSMMRLQHSLKQWKRHLPLRELRDPRRTTVPAANQIK